MSGVSKSGIPASYIANRLFTFFLTVIIAATVIWIIPRLSPVDPAEAMLGRMASGAGFVENADQILADLRTRFGLDEPLWKQYLVYIKNLLVFVPLAVILEVASLPLLHTAWASCLLLSAVNAAVLAVRIRNEEAALGRLPAWRDAMAGRARLFPGLF